MIRVLVVDDSPLVRKIATDILNGDPEIRVVATAANADFALQKVEREKPDVITMDLEMPGSGGLEAIRRIMEKRPTPVIVLSAYARRGADLTLQALESGAVEFVLKPSSSLSGGIDAVGRELVAKVKAAVDMHPARGERSEGRPAAAPSDTSPSPVPPRRPTAREPGRFALVSIGTSTGGPVALKSVLSGLPEGFPLPIVVVQHMPPVFTKAFADRLNSSCRLRVREAESGDALRPAEVLIAPGNLHMTVSRYGAQPIVLLNQRDPVCGHRPSVDVLMRSVAAEYGERAIGVIMTGMGKDGADGLRELHRRGGYVIAQDKDSSVIYGMNREVVQNGDADEIAPLRDIPQALMNRIGLPNPVLAGR